MRKYYLYIHINKVNGKVYIGITCAIHPNLRWKYGYGYKNNKHFWSAIQKYGWDGFYHIIIRTGLSFNEAKELERRWIYLFRADDKKFGYNKTRGGDGCDRGKDCYNPELIREKSRLNAQKRRARDPEKVNERARLYYHTHKDACMKAQKRWNEAHKEERREIKNEYSKRWKEQNPEKAREIQKRYKEKLKIKTLTRNK